MPGDQEPTDPVLKICNRYAAKTASSEADARLYLGMRLWELFTDQSRQHLVRELFGPSWVEAFKQSSDDEAVTSIPPTQRKGRQRTAGRRPPIDLTVLERSNNKAGFVGVYPNGTGWRAKITAPNGKPAFLTTRSAPEWAAWDRYKYIRDVSQSRSFEEYIKRVPTDIKTVLPEERLRQMFEEHDRYSATGDMSHLFDTTKLTEDALKKKAELEAKFAWQDALDPLAKQKLLEEIKAQPELMEVESKPT